MHTLVTKKDLTTYLFAAIVILYILPANMYQTNAMEKERIDAPVFTHKDNANKFRIGKGEEFQVHLTENPATGFQWAILSYSSPNLALIDKKFTQKKDRHMLGAGGIRIFIFKALKPGHAALHLVLKRPWEKEEKYADTYSLKFLIE